MAIDWLLVLDIIARSEKPDEALQAFVTQEREDAAHKAKAGAWHEGWRAGFEDRGRIGIVDAKPTTNPYRD